MTELSEQIQRIQWLLQDTNTDATTISKVATAHQESLQALARRDYFSNILWQNAIQGQATYLLPDPVISVVQVLYDQHVLRYATERSLDRLLHKWEALPGEPLYWTQDNQAPNTIRIIPAPSRTGSTVPVIPSPLFQDMVDNLVIFMTEDPSDGLTDSADVLPTMLDWDDWLVFSTTKMLAQREIPEQNLPVSDLCEQLETLWRTYLRT